MSSLSICDSIIPASEQNAIEAAAHAMFTERPILAQTMRFMGGYGAHPMDFEDEGAIIRGEN